MDSPFELWCIQIIPESDSQFLMNIRRFMALPLEWFPPCYLFPPLLHFFLHSWKPQPQELIWAIFRSPIYGSWPTIWEAIAYISCWGESKWEAKAGSVFWLNVFFQMWIGIGLWIKHFCRHSNMTLLLEPEIGSEEKLQIFHTKSFCDLF